MVRTDLIRFLADQYPDLSARDIEKIVSAFFDTITKRLADGGRAEIRGFGSFSTRTRQARTGRNPRTGESVELSDRRVPWFKAGKDLCELINGGDPTVPGKKGMAANAAIETQPAPNFSTEDRE
ncbi:HU family DNA-binding protein [Sphingomonas sp. PWP1-2]|uniref:HU family DNA-binding protein n=1 Tax=Sphingomonas sp. PWP1-2 TaxID=2804558 RepID=UPI003CEEED8A